MKVEIITRCMAEQLVKNEVTKQLKGLYAQIVEQLSKHNTSIKGVFLADSDPVSLLKPSVRLDTAFRNANITTIGQLTTLHPSDLMKFRNFGKVCLSELEVRLAFHGRQLK